MFPSPPPPDPPPPPGPRHGWDLRPVRPGLLAGIAVGAGVLLWALAGCPGLILAIAVAAAVIIRLLGALFLPRRLREHSIIVALLAGLVVLLLQSSWSAVALTVGLAGIAVALTQRRRTCSVALAVAALLGILGGVGLTVDHLSAAARKDAEYQAAGDVGRGQMLPHTPDRVPKDLMRRVAVALTESTGNCTLLFDDHGLRAFLDAWHTTDCTTALRTLGATVTEPERYDRIETDSLTITPQPDGTVVVDTCGVRWQDTSLPFFTGTRAPVPHYGPAPGRLRVTPAYRVAWQITDYQPC
ncbi:hypothetical protein [Pseudonocardia sp. GCM10023141]|uniref:hypothetical protein n=1 Tax=Pseudonocardia sp. GCM10023141 TaxID=3252653 RepID=UPI003621C8D9